MLLSYPEAKSKLKPLLRHTRDREIRVKAELILLACKLGNVSEACARRGFSRKFFYKWYRRLKRADWKLSSLREYSRRPKKRSPHRVKESLERRIKSLHRLGYGAPTIQAHLARQGKKLSGSTICHILRGRKKSGPRTKREKLKAHRRRYEIPIPGLRLQMDVKHVPEQIGGLKAYSYVIIDECTRMRLIHGYTAINPSNTIDFLERAKAFFPFPIRQIQTDNGSEFTYRFLPQVEVLHPMDEWCERNQILHRCIPPGEKELNGKVERSHRIDEQAFYWRAPTESLERFNEALSNWVTVYNHERLHGGIVFKTPYEKLLERYDVLRKARIEGYDQIFQLRFVNELPRRLQVYKDRVGIRDAHIPWVA